MAEITFVMCVGIRAPIEPGEYVVRNKRIGVSYPPSIAIEPLGVIELPKSLSTMFVVSWTDDAVASQLRSQTYERHLPRYVAVAAISELLLAYKLVRMGHSDSLGLRTVGIGDVLVYFSAVDGVPTGDLNVALKNYAGNSAWGSVSLKADPHETSKLAAPHIGADTLPVERRYVRCYELIEHGFYSEAFLVAFAILDDFVQDMLHGLLMAKGFSSRDETEEFLKGIKEQRLRLYLGPVLKLAAGCDLKSLWPESEAALKWLNSTRNKLTHEGEVVDYAAAAKGIYVSLKVLVVLKEAGLAKVDLTPRLFRHAKITAAWTLDPPSWVPSGPLTDSLDFLG